MMDVQGEIRYSDQPVLAFTGMSGIFPGSPDVDAFWRRIVRAEVAPLTSLEERWGIPRSAYFDPEPGRPDRVCLDRAFCLPEDGDARGRQIAYACKAVGSLLEDLGRQGAEPNLSEVGLVLGTSWSDPGYFYEDIDLFFGEEERRLDALSRRFSPDEQIREIQERHHLGAAGIAVDAACASSLYAVEMAAGLLRSNQARAVIVLGLSVNLPFFLMAGFSQLMALAANGMSLPFSEGACGMVPAEGVGAVFLEPLEDALLSGRKVLGILRAVGLSSDGAEGSVFAPGTVGQDLAYRRAYQDIGSPDVDYIEAHGTATVIGDEAETASIDRFFGRHPEKNHKIAVGSVKALIGHALAAAGMASLIKALLMLRENVIPPHIPVTPHPRLANSCIALPAAPSPLPDKDRRPRIGISSFGFGGSNAHMVVDGYDERKGKGRLVSGKAYPTASALAIVDMEAAFGTALCAAEWRKRLDEEALSFAPFPPGRFSRSWGDEVQGLFFPEELEIDTRGLRMGPKMLSRIDPLQNLASYLIGLLVRRHQGIQKSEDTAVILCSNMGGGKALQLARRHFLRVFRPHSGKQGAAATSLEELASGLGSMLSGYPALHFDLRALHQTLSGDPRLFWTALLTAPFLLSRHCRHLLLGGGHYFKTPLDFRHPNVENGSEIRPLLVEGFAVFLLKDLERAKEDGDPVLAEVRAIVTGREARNFEEACLAAGIEPAVVDLRESCRLDAGLPSEGPVGAGGRASLFLGEASGIEALASALLKEGRLASIEVWSGGQLLLVLFLEKRGRFCPGKEATTLPLRLSFRDPSLSPSNGDPQNPDEKPTYVQPFRKPDPAEQNVPQTAWDADTLLLWHRGTAEVLVRYLRLQKKIIEAFPEGIENERPLVEGGIREIADPPCRPAVRAPKRREENRVVHRIRFLEQQRRYQAELIVDETHPYFFDHPLDHVPGILLLEGFVQLLEVAIRNRLPDGGDRAVLIREIDVLFTKWCEKDRPVTLLVEHGGRDPERGVSFLCKARQNGEIVGRVTLKTDSIQTSGTAQYAPRPPSLQPSSRYAFLHKQRPENVVVSELQRTGDCYFVEALPPPQGHILSDGDPEHYSCVYLLEASRQCALMITHAVAGVPLDLSMVLLWARMKLRRPVLRKERFTIAFVPEARAAFRENTMESMNLLLTAEEEVLGRTSVHALIVDSKEYGRQRWKRQDLTA